MIENIVEEIKQIDAKGIVAEYLAHKLFDIAIPKLRNSKTNNLIHEETENKPLTISSTDEERFFMKLVGKVV